jgi:hypothetical protein
MGHAFRNDPLWTTTSVAPTYVQRDRAPVTAMIHR